MTSRIPVPSKVVCVGRNYVDHAKELGNEVPPAPLLFLKAPSALIGPGDPIVLPPESRQVEYEAEIGVVVGKRLTRVSAEEAERGIDGYVCLNDVTARDLQRTDGQWTRAKGFDTFCPVGPRVAKGLNWKELEVVGRVNGVVRQHGRASDMVFPIPTLLSYISGIMTLFPGDLIATGTPAGVGPLAPGDIVEVEVPGVGVLRNPVKAFEGAQVAKAS
jgi:2-keto-4-pentenoate hydratase/2-oxohepta-3-ene-1,7-dioic acid hydratase in catechol pathway